MKKLIEVMQNSATTKTYSLREVFVNPAFVVSLVPDTNTKRLLSDHNTVPIIVRVSKISGKQEFIGGFDDFICFLQEEGYEKC